MELFDDKSTLEFAAGLMDSIEKRGSMRQKARTAVGAVDSFLNAKFYDLSRKDIPKARPSHVPYRVRVRFHAKADNNKFFGFELDEREKQQSWRDHYNFELGRNVVMVIWGGQEPLEKFKEVLKIINGIVVFLKEKLGALSENDFPMQRHHAETEFFAEVPTFREAEKLLDPLLWQMNALARLLGGKSFKWVWITRSKGGQNKNELAYYYPENTDENKPANGRQRSQRVGVANPYGEQAIVHDVLRHQVPEIVWDYENDSRWGISKAEKNKITKGEQPHLVYIPLLDRLAIFFYFGPNDNPVSYLDEGRNLSHWVSTSVLSAFQDAIYIQTLLLLESEPTLVTNPIQRKKLSVDERHRLLSGILNSILDLYPVPTLALKNGSKSLEFVYQRGDHRDGNDPIIEMFKHQATVTFRRANLMAAALQDKRDYKIYGVSQMGMVHTLKRPLTHMRGFVAMLDNEGVGRMNKYVQSRIDETKRYLDEMSPYCDLEIKSAAAINKLNEGDKTTERATPESILKAFRECGFIDKEIELRSGKTGSLSIRVPGFSCNLDIKWMPSVIYQSPAGPLALLIFELVANAAKYYDENKDEFDQGRKLSILVYLGKTITVENEIVLGTEKDVITKIALAWGTPGTSLYRILQLSEMIGYKFDSQLSSGGHKININLKQSKP